MRGDRGTLLCPLDRSRPIPSQAIRFLYTGRGTDSTEILERASEAGRRVLQALRQTENINSEKLGEGLIQVVWRVL